MFVEYRMLYFIKKRIQRWSYHKRQQCGECQSEHYRCRHSAEHDIEQQRNHTENGCNGSHQYRTGTRHRRLDDSTVTVDSCTPLNIHFIEKHDHVLDYHAQQSKPAGHTEEAEVKPCQEQSYHTPISDSGSIRKMISG